MNIKRGEIWLVNLAPTIGAEIRKTRPVVVVNSDWEHSQFVVTHFFVPEGLMIIAHRFIGGTKAND